MRTFWLNDGINPVPSLEDQQAYEARANELDAIVFGPSSVARLYRESGKTISFGDPDYQEAFDRLHTALFADIIGGDIEPHPLSAVAILASLDQ